MEADGVRMPERINNLRIGAAILRGENSFTGGTLAGFDDSAFTLEAELVEMGRQIPLGGRMATPEEIARVAVFLAAEDSGWITGQTIHVNGGAFMGG